MDRRPAGESLPPPSECPQNQSVLPSQRAPRTVQVVGTDGAWPSLRARSRSLRSCHDSCPPVSASRHCAMGSRPRGGTAQTRARLQPPRSHTLPAPRVQSSCLVLSLLLSAVCRHVLGHLLTLFACLRVRRQSQNVLSDGVTDAPPPCHRQPVRALRGQQPVSRQSKSVTHIISS